MSGYAAVILFLAGGMILAIRRFEGVATAQITHIRAEESKITLGERLRSKGELIVSAGRGYLISGDPALLGKLQETEAEFDRAVHALKSENLASGDASLIVAVERAAKDFRRVQEELFVAGQRTEDVRAIARRFETDLLPRRRDLSEALDRLVDSRNARIGEVYQQADSDRALWSLWIHGLLGALVLTGLGVAWYFTRLLARSYHKEQEALQVSQKAVAARDDLMGIVAHDLRNPLSAISMKAAVLRAVSDSEVVRNQADSIENVATQMAYLIETMLDVATLEAGRLSVTPASCCVENLLSEASEMFSTFSASRRIQLVRTPTEAGLAVQADRRRVLQALSNLLGNALKFTPDGGEVRLSAIRHGRTTRFAVCDTGPGIAASHLPQIFDRFWKHETGGKRGTGLGLFITKGIIDAHGGQLWVESEPNRGAAFYFTLPLADPKVFTASATESSGRRALVA